MKIAIGVVLICALTLSVMPAGAGDTFQAFRGLPSVDQATLAPLSDDQLAAVEGGGGLFGQSFDILSNILASLNQLSQIGQNVAHQISQLPAQVHAESVTVFQVNQDTGGSVQTNMTKVQQY